MSSKFESALKSTLSNEAAITENGAVGFKTTGKALLDLNFAVSSLRSGSASAAEKMFSDAFYENPLAAVKWLFFARDVRGGLGERRLFRTCFAWLAKARPKLAKRLVKLVSEYGRFDDLFCLVGTELEPELLEVVDSQWLSDLTNMQDGKPISLLAKWMPSINTSSAKTVALARKFAKALDLSEKQYRKSLSKLRAYLNVLEVKMSAKQWNEIDYEAVPSKANVKYNAAFLRNDETRRREFLGALEKGEAKINSSTNFPCDIVHAYAGKFTSKYEWSGRKTVATFTVDPALEAMWKALPDYVKDQSSGSTIVVADGSGSMMSPVGSSTSCTALEVANSLAIYFAEKLTGPYKDKYITFSSHPQYVDFSNAKSLAEKISIALGHSEVENTNVEAVFDLILKSAVDNGLKQEDIPANVLVVSDMEFDACAVGNAGWISRYDAKSCALFEVLKERYEAAGYKMPRLVFWNVNSRTGTIPLKENDMGVALISGFSPAVASMVFSAKLDPYEVLLDAVNAERYAPVEEAVKGLV